MLACTVLSIPLLAASVTADRQPHTLTTGPGVNKVAGTATFAVAKPIVARLSGPASLYESHSAAYWHWRFTVARRIAYQRGKTVRQLQHRWAPTVQYALRLASAVFGVPYSELASVSYCESTWNPGATNGGQLGLFQLAWSPFGFSAFDPVANALSAAATVKRDGGWRQWSCKP